MAYRTFDIKYATYLAFVIARLGMDSRRQKKTSSPRGLQESSREPMNGRSLQRAGKKTWGEKKIATLFPPVGANRARLRHAGRSLRARGCSLFISSTGILVPERLSSLSGDDSGATTEGRDSSSLFLGHREKL